MSIGSKIKELRRAKHLTQSDLVGGEITRNMLSRIESDKASPSLGTLLYLADRLSVSPAYLIEEGRTLLDEKKASALPRIKEAYARGNFKEAIRLYERDLGEYDDEIALLIAEASMRYALELMHKGRMLSAEREAERAETMCGATVYSTAHIRAPLATLRAILRNVQTPRYEAARIPFAELKEEALLEDLYCYIAEDSTEHRYFDEILRLHAQAKRLITSGRYADAITALEALEARKAERDFSVFVLFRIYGDLESCHKELRNYEAAYRYSAKRMSLLSAFKA